MKLIKDTILILILFTILFASILSISAADVNNNLDNITSDTNTNDLNHLQDNAGELNNPIGNLNNSEVEHNINNSASENIDLDNSTQYTITQTSDNTFIITMADNTTLNVCELGVNDLISFKNACVFIAENDIAYDLLILEFKDHVNIEIDPWSTELISPKNLKNIMIRGNDATLSIKHPNNPNILHFLKVKSNTVVTIYDLTLKGFNTAIMNYGTCQMKNVKFIENVIDFRFETKYYNDLLLIPDFSDIPDLKGEMDYGGAIKNFGALSCEDCTFSDNIARLGGAVYNEAGSQSSFVNCNFNGNKYFYQLIPTIYDFEKPTYVYDYADLYDRKLRLPEHEGFDCNNVYDIYTCDLACCYVYNDNDAVYVAFINSTQDLMTFINNAHNKGYIKYCILNFLPNTTYNIKNDFETMNFRDIENLYINGNGAIINVVDSDSSEECHFIKLQRKCSCLINNLTFIGFNQVFINQGTLNIVDSTFKRNKCDYIVCKDYGSSIYNDEGLVYISNTVFEGGYAKKGGAIYNEKGMVICNGCNFKSNTVYGDGGAIYNEYGVVTCDSCIFTANKGENGGSIYNYYGKLITTNNIFNASTATDDGGAIYNDFGEITIGNNTFINSKAEDGANVFSYGDEAKVSIISESYSIKITGDKITNQTMKVTEDGPNEVVRWIVRGVEVVLCVGLCVGCTLLGVPEATAGIICFVGGCLLAGAEEVIEECCMDHNFNVFNCLAMMVIAGMFDCCGAMLGTWVGHTFFETGLKELGKEASFKLGAICFGIELTGEIISEVLPRIDFTEKNMPITPVNMTNPQIPIN